jgi:signal transduction histidine kinase/ActR/RegA family two-component response regulator
VPDRVRQSWYLLAGNICIVGLAAISLSAAGTDETRVYRVGADQAPPYYFLHPDGTAGGLGVEVLNEAARRTGVKLKWVPQSTEGVDEAFRQGKLDLWPALAVTPWQRGIHMTQPWLRNDFILIGREQDGTPSREAVQGKVVAIRPGPLIRLLVAQHLPGAIMMERRNREDALAAVCHGEASVSFVEARFLDAALLKRPAGCEMVSFKVAPVPGARSELSIASNDSAAATADRLRDAIGAMASDGTLSTLLEKWSVFSSVDARSVYALQVAQQKQRLTAIGLIAAILAGLVLVWQITRARAAGLRARQAQYVAERANAAKGEFLANMSHELRTPLNAVIGMSHLVLEGPIGEAQREDLKVIRDSASSLLGIINDILDFSKIEAGRMRLEARAFDLEARMRQALTLVGIKTRIKNLELQFDYSPALQRFYIGDEGRIRQIALNFLSNAIKFTDSGVIRLAISPVERGGPGVRIAVIDTGLGIEEEKQAGLFTKFWQADASTTRKHGGTGLGLAISKQLAELMGGRVGVTSRPGEGSTFWAELPLDPAPDTSRQAAEPAAAPAQGSASQGVKILLAEDNRLNQRLVVRSLEKLGYVVEVASTGAEAVTLCEDGEYAVILMDCQMPVLDGYQATAEIRRRQGKSRRTPIIALTAHAMPGDEMRCRDAGMDDYLSKPVDLPTLVRTVERYSTTYRQELQ